MHISNQHAQEISSRAYNLQIKLITIVWQDYLRREAGLLIVISQVTTSHALRSESLVNNQKTTKTLMFYK